MNIPVFIVDAFTNLPFKGNPACVCLLQKPLSEELYQKIATEMNLSETAFVICKNSADNFSTASRFNLRWFSPTNEVCLCGHATLASSAVLFYHKKNINREIVFDTLSGELCIRMRGDCIVMDFPLYTSTPQDPHEVADLIKVVVGDLPLEDARYSEDTKKLLLRLADTCDTSALTSLKPDPEKMMTSEHTGKVKGVIVTIKGAPAFQPGYDFFSRYFSPWNGIPEDPVTGSAHSVLAKYWSEKLGKQRLLAYQTSSRGGELELETKGHRLDIAGRAVFVLQGTMTL
ncbi:phenazine biosynthesis-like domain-containing protein [Clupea harengus]|uniref:Phenazine biosynthesis-like domain-containing protein n=1 Tax=Clupea harengus TaxID=7950 RepID=A0A6P3VIA3_CLUHA|nr:phenazine biosynthesis-like domain-containing protein [Clupea harengus]